MPGREDILYELDGLKSEISDPVQLHTLDRIAAEIKRLQKIIDGRSRTGSFTMEAGKLYPFKISEGTWKRKPI